jgi:hypothetical protein
MPSQRTTVLVLTYRSMPAHRCRQKGLECVDARRKRPAGPKERTKPFAKALTLPAGLCLVSPLVLSLLLLSRGESVYGLSRDHDDMIMTTPWPVAAAAPDD